MPHVKKGVRSSRNPFGVVGDAQGGNVKNVGPKRPRMGAVQTTPARPTATAQRAARQAQNRALAGRDTVPARKTIAKRKRRGY